MLALLIVVALVAVGIIRGTPSEVQPYSLPSGSLDASSPALDGAGGQDVEPPASGPGALVYAQAEGPLLGSDGPTRRFQVAVESNLEGELDGFATAAEAALADPRSWIADKKQSFRRVPATAPTDFVIMLVTRDTAYRLCATIGLDIREDGVPYTSCQVPGRVVVNLDRWHKSVPDYVDSGASLDTYRHYVINHEVGHVLGRPHEPCPGPGQRAPVMLQQTLGLNGCTANPWPYPDAAA